MDAERRQYCHMNAEGPPPVFNCSYAKEKIFAPHINIIPPGYSDLCFHCLCGTRASDQSCLAAYLDLVVSLLDKGIPPEQNPRFREEFDALDEANAIFYHQTSRSAPPTRHRLMYLRDVTLDDDGRLEVQSSNIGRAMVDLVANRLGQYIFSGWDNQLYVYELPGEGGPFHVLSNRTNLDRFMAGIGVRCRVPALRRLEVRPSRRARRRRQSEPSASRSQMAGVTDGRGSGSGGVRAKSTARSRSR
ncbi:hypothetical protein F5Y13DRAFT_190445 [Hypoxylon sp. FL1857]|nr:hypothetical protein F5Y13DRAFT_190445 [Hypoxylon sp. FL1857]